MRNQTNTIEGEWGNGEKIKQESRTQQTKPIEAKNTLIKLKEK